MPKSYKLLIADDEFNTRELLGRYLRRRYDVDTAMDGVEAISKLESNDYDLVLTDLRMPGADGFEVLEKANNSGRKTPCIVLTAYGSIVDAVKAVKAGAFDFVSKPVKLDQLETVISSALARAGEVQDEAKTDAGEKTVPTSGDSAAMVAPGDGSAMKHIYDTACDVAPSRATVLLTGESGTGKEVIARLIHEKSLRKGKFVAVHCAALTSTLLESELFGYEKGAFTGATERRQGKFEAADSGTIFLDEVGEIDLPTQVKLLRVLETRCFERVGGVEQVKSDFRLISATNKDLKQMVKEGTFREDLYYRLAVIDLELPPLRRRRDEIPLLVGKFIREFAAENGKDVPTVAPEAMSVLVSCDWPGNIRQLRNCMESVVVLLKDAVIRVEDLPEEIRNGSSVEPDSPAAPEEGTGGQQISGQAIRDVEWELIEKVLAECNGNRTKAAERLGISRRTIQRRLLEHAENKQ